MAVQERPFYQLPYPEEEHEGRVLLGDPKAIELDRRWQAYRWIRDYLREKLKHVDVTEYEVVFTTLCNIQPQAHPQSIFRRYWPNGEPPELDDEYWDKCEVFFGERIPKDRRKEIFSSY